MPTRHSHKEHSRGTMSFSLGDPSVNAFYSKPKNKRKVSSLMPSNTETVNIVPSVGAFRMKAFSNRSRDALVQGGGSGIVRRRVAQRIRRKKARGKRH